MIGILAGMGPKSTGPFIDIVVDQCQKIYGAKDDIDFPPMMIYSCPTPFYLDKPLEHEQMKESIIRGAQRLEDTGITFMAMPCNTAHLYYEEIQKSLTVPLLNMVDETIKAIPEKTSRVTILATSATVQSGIYQEALLTAGINVFQKDSWQHHVNEIITNIKEATWVRRVNHGSSS